VEKVLECAIMMLFLLTMMFLLTVMAADMGKVKF
jgi:hypothetical protein